ncbi:mechanosensitive ion channel family protein [Metabacillus sp. GX 13764]|uniref:mechanosensitive ion channel family protein n=1 Tax=Metabacillus kandeliae TaxID=2900151 RepID=UPI001E644B8D|nr:mechanosensitive ion channel family protein [Metabacillus kandeliae]MCD7034789.1 mechanosensitive ion channel family protein [Metabacillus kandeliae]
MISSGELIQTAISIGIFVLFLILRKLFTKYVFQLVMKLSHKTPTDVFTHILLSLEKPLRWSFVLLGIYTAIHYLPFLDNKMGVVNQFYRSSIVILIAWALYNLTGVSSIFFNKINKRFELDMDDILAPFLSKVLRFLIFALTFSIVAQEFHYDVNGFVAGLGLGGLAFALAAKDTIGNFFGGVILITEKPFTLGDWIKTPNAEGVVEEISFRSTKIRTFQQSLVTVPNSTIANEPITNWTKMGKRQITFNLGVTYHAEEEQLHAAVKRIEKMLQEHDGIHDDVIIVAFEKFSAHSLDVYVNCFTKTTDFKSHLHIRQDINFKIMKIFEEESISFAFPTQTLIVEQNGKRSMETEEERKYEMAQG